VHPPLQAPKDEPGKVVRMWDVTQCAL